MQPLSDLAEEIRAAQASARERSRERLTAARTRLLRQMAEGTHRGVRAVAAQEALEVRHVARADEHIPDATEEFRQLLRDYWAAQRPAREAAQ